jgi:hypothetical protein
MQPQAAAPEIVNFQEDAYKLLPGDTLQFELQ